MEVKGHLITSMGLLGALDAQVRHDGKLQAERVAALQERKRALEALLSARVDELKLVCFQEAELTGKLPRAFPLETGEKPPTVRRRAGAPPPNDDVARGRRMKAMLTGALYRHAESDGNLPNGKRTVHRGCHTEGGVPSESTSSVSDSTSHDDERPPGVAADRRSLSQPGLSAASPDRAIRKKLSPVEIYYEMRTRRNSLTGSVSPTHSLPRSASNAEGRSVPATPLLARTTAISVHVRSDASGSNGLKQWSGSLDAPYMIPLAREGLSTSRARRSYSSEALLDRSGLPDRPPNGTRPAGGPRESSQAPADGNLRHVRPGGPEKRADGSGERAETTGGRGAGAGRDDPLTDYVWGQRQRMRARPDLFRSPPSRRPRGRGAAPDADGFSRSQLHLPGAAPPFSPAVGRGAPADARGVKVARTKSCGPFVPLREAAPPSAYESRLPAPGTEASVRAFPGRAPQLSLATPEDATRSLHKALALEGLRDWYLRNALGYPPKGHQAGVSRLSHARPQAQSVQGQAGNPHRPQMSQSVSFHGHPLHGRSTELSLYQETPHPQTQEGAPEEPSADPGTLV
ncbi:coiled-coil domain-containing protein 120 [Hippocampus zosterae]|uniref:coiled-coil domain-containing protein 120 n=1 Tax=Hippocampus zosterae TaxID=109293 RepID=UPI00223CBF04|nr:coiled-coil domain-containing protein 120 [Hippocampus zosterae]